MAEGGVSGKGLAAALVGSILCYSAVKGRKISVVVRDLVAGKDPTTSTSAADYPVNDPTQGGSYIDPSNPATIPGGPFTGQLPKNLPGGKLTPTQIYKYALGAGFNPIAAIIVTAISMAEDPGGDPRALNDNPSTGDLSYGLMQINMIGSLGAPRRQQFGISSNEQLFDPATNMHAAYIVSHGGNVFTPWTTFTSGKYLSHLAEAQAAAKAA